jgi:hypothetical protein
VKYTKENGVIAIDTNASPIHLAIAEVSKTGELLSYQTISLTPPFRTFSKQQRPSRVDISPSDSGFSHSER